MPNIDKTGPLGTGPTGRGRGGCMQTDTAEETRMRGRGGRCRNRNRGTKHGFCNRGRDDQTVLSHETEIETLERSLSSLQARLNLLKAAKPEEPQ